MDELVTAWLAGGSGCACAVGEWSQLALVADALAARGVPVRSGNRELLDRLGDDADGADRAALDRAWTAWTEALQADRGPLALHQLELAVAERLDLTRLATIARPVLLLVPGGLAYATATEAGVPLPPAVCPAGRAWSWAADRGWDVRVA